MRVEEGGKREGAKMVADVADEIELKIDEPIDNYGEEKRASNE